MSELSLRDLADSYEQIQRVRLAAENRIRATLQGVDKTVADKLIASDIVVQRLTEAELEHGKRMEAALHGHCCQQWLMGVPGIKGVLSAKVLGMIDDPRKYPRFSNLRSFAGICPGRNKLVKGEKATFSPRLKKTLFIVFGGLLKAGAIKLKQPPQRLYSEIYSQWRSTYLARHGAGSVKKKKDGQDESGNKYTSTDEVAQQWPDLRQHLASKNKLLDVFLFHLYEEWMTCLGEPVAGLYVHEVLGHHMKYERAEFSSPAMSKRKCKQSA